MVVDVVRGKPTVAPSKTSHFLSKNRTQTPGGWDDSDRSSSETDYEPNADSRAITPTSARDTGDSPFEGKSDKATEMALISASHGEVPKSAHSSQGMAVASTSQVITTDETTDPSSQDTTLRELQEQARGLRRKVMLDKNT